uniref:Uncharacterized protein n=1 Tax=Cucumis melo TaxID=3656 RepID=A0A9I9DSP8_CUCME
MAIGVGEGKRVGEGVRRLWGTGNGLGGLAIVGGRRREEVVGGRCLSEKKEVRCRGW